MRINGQNQGGHLGGPQASIYTRPAKGFSNNPKFKRNTESKTVEGEVVDVDFTTVEKKTQDKFSSRETNPDLAYSLYARSRARINKQETIEASAKKVLSPEEQAFAAINEKLSQIDKRLARIEDALAFNGGTKNFTPTDLPELNYDNDKLSADPNISYKKHVSDYSSLVKGMQELYQFKRDMGVA